MTRNPVACDVNDSVEVAAKHMRDKGVGCIVALENGAVRGLLTDRQIATHVLAEGKGKETKIGDVMTPNPATLSLDDNIFAAVDTMRSANLARRVPVVNDQKQLIGIVSVSDLAVIAKDLVEHILLESTHHALEETKILTGAKSLVKDIRRPTKTDRLPPKQSIKAVTEPTPEGLPTEAGGAGDVWTAEDQRKAREGRGNVREEAQQKNR